MSKDDGARLTDACLLVPAGLIIAGVATYVSAYVALLVFAAFVAIVIYEVRERQRNEVRAINFRIEEPKILHSIPKGGEWDSTIRSIRRLHQSLHDLISANEQQAIVQTIGPDVILQSNDLVDQAEKVHQRQRKLWLSVTASKVSQDEIEELRTKIESETDERMKSALAGTLAFKRSEFESVAQMAKDATYQGALLSQAEASLSEMRSRLALTIAQALEYTKADQGEALTDANNNLRSVSEAMRQTLTELK